MTQNSNYKYKLGAFVIFGLAIFVITVYFIGQSKNLFSDTIALNAKFKNVSGLKEGNHVRFSGIDVGTVNAIEFVSDSAVIVTFIIKEDIQKFIKTDANASIGSDGLMGDKVLTISPGTVSTIVIQENATIASTKAVEIEDLMKGLQISVDNAGVITNQLATFTANMNDKDGVISKLMTDEKFANSITNTLYNLENSSSNFSTFTKR